MRQTKVSWRAENCTPALASRESLSIPVDVALNLAARLVVGKLDRRRFHKVRGRSYQGAFFASVQGQLATPDSVYDDASRIGTVPYLQLQFQVQGNVAEGSALHADVAPLPVVQPGHIVAGPHVNVVFGKLKVHLGSDGGRLGDLFRLQPLPLQHV